MSITEMAKALKLAHQWAEWELESLALFHAYGQRFGGTPGGNVFMFALEDALRHRGVTLDQFRTQARESGLL